MRRCGAWPARGGCVLPAGHNMGQADVPDAHVFGLDYIQRPRVSWCPFTRKWMMSPRGHRHECRPVNYHDQAFRHWSDAVDAAIELYEQRLGRVVARLMEQRRNPS